MRYKKGAAMIKVTPEAVEKARALLIEEDDTFTRGRRNDDFVNIVMLVACLRPCDQEDPVQLAKEVLKYLAKIKGFAKRIDYYDDCQYINVADKNEICTEAKALGLIDGSCYVTGWINKLGTVSEWALETLRRCGSIEGFISGYAFRDGYDYMEEAFVYE
jgi:hypothetical protein